MAWLRDLIELTPYFGFMVGAALLALGTEAGLMGVARRRRARLARMKRAAMAGDWATVASTPVPGPGAEIAGALALLVVPAITILSVHRARELAARSLLDVGTDARAADRAAMLWSGLAGQLHAMRFGIVLEELIGALGVLSLSLAFTARRYTAGIATARKLADRDRIAAKAWLRFPGPDTEAVFACSCAVAALAFLPLLQGVGSYCALLLKRLTPLAGASPGEIAARTEQVDVILLEARRALEAGATASRLGLALAVVTSAVILWWRSPARARRRWLGRPVPSAPPIAPRRLAGPWIAGACALLAAVALWGVARMLSAEGVAPGPGARAAAPAPAPVKPGAPADRPG